jgi:hypothetical protein
VSAKAEHRQAQHPAPGPETPSKRAARQLADLMRRHAEFFKETYESAFPEPSLEGAPSIVVDGHRLTLSSPDNRPISPSLVERIQRAIEEFSASSNRK